MIIAKGVLTSVSRYRRTKHWDRRVTRIEKGFKSRSHEEDYRANHHRGDQKTSGVEKCSSILRLSYKKEDYILFPVCPRGNMADSHREVDFN